MLPVSYLVFFEKTSLSIFIVRSLSFCVVKFILESVYPFKDLLFKFFHLLFLVSMCASSLEMVGLKV